MRLCLIVLTNSWIASTETRPYFESVKELIVTYDPERHHRRSIRLKGYDYTQPGAYFITICTEGRVCILADIVNGEAVLSPFGKLVCKTWNDLASHYPHLRLDAFVVMPNHIHAIMVLVDDLFVGAGLSGCDQQFGEEIQPQSHPRPALIERNSPLQKRHAIPEIVRALKSFSARAINYARETPGASVWQRDYYEHIIRNEEELFTIRTYIVTNPLGWDSDRDNPRFFPD